MPITHQEGRTGTPFGQMNIYSEEEDFWLRAMEALTRRIRQSRTRRLGVPSCSEVLAEALRLGYRRLEPAVCAAYDQGHAVGIVITTKSKKPTRGPKGK